MLTPELEQQLLTCEKALDARVRANTIMAMAALNMEIPALEEKFFSVNNRLAADAIYVAGQKEFTEVLYNRIHEFMHSDQPRFIASGLYLTAALIEHHQQKDIVYLKTNSNLKALAKEISNFILHPDPMVQARAKKSLEIVEHGGFLET
jgi:hypothetical protein